MRCLEIISVQILPFPNVGKAHRELYNNKIGHIEKEQSDKAKL